MKSVRRKTLGVILIIMGFLALVTPFTPGSWLILIGFELVGLRLLLKGRLRFLFKGKLGRKLRHLVGKVMRKFPRRDSQPKTSEKKPLSR
jgi:hypothetical protein